MWRGSGISADSFYEVRPEYADNVPKTRFKIKIGKTLSRRKWQAAFSTEGHLDIGKTLNRIQRGGVHPSIRGEVWEFLLGCYDPQSSFDEREHIQQKRRGVTNGNTSVPLNCAKGLNPSFDDITKAQYALWKDECHKLFPVIGSGRFVTAPIINEEGKPIQDPLVLKESKFFNGSAAPAQKNYEETTLSDGYASSPTNNSNDNEPVGTASHGSIDKKEIQWKLTLHQIGLDVVRTDRTLVFYENQENLSKLWDILAVYAWIDKDIGYCQEEDHCQQLHDLCYVCIGMSDLCSPMIILLEDEADAFWCFERLMRRLRGNFKCTASSVGVEKQLRNLAEITQVIDPRLHQHLETLGGGDYLFAFRMLMVLFRREFSFGDSLFLWEMMWALEYDPGLFSSYEFAELNQAAEAVVSSRGKVKSIRQCGKYERENLRNRGKNGDDLPISVFLVASVLKDKSSKLLHEARGLDDVLKILNDTNGNLDAKKACIGAMKAHKKYLRKANKS